MKGSGKPDDRKGHVRFDVAGAGNGFTVRLVRHRQTKETEQIGFTYGTPRQSWTLLSASFVILSHESEFFGLRASFVKRKAFKPLNRCVQAVQADQWFARTKFKYPLPCGC